MGVWGLVVEGYGAGCCGAREFGGKWSGYDSVGVRFVVLGTAVVRAVVTKGDCGGVGVDSRAMGLR